MTYANLEGESDRDREKRHQVEYDAYVAECRAGDIEPINFMNWNTSRKFNEKIANGERAIDRREKPRDG
jgi:hypothetical protein